MYIVTIINNGVETIINHVSSNIYDRITGTIKQGINCIDSFSFNIYPNNVGYNLIKSYSTLVNVFNTKTNKYEFRGRVLKLNEIMNPNSKDKINKEYRNKVYKTKEEYKKETTKETVEDIIKATNKKLDSYFESENDIKEYLTYMAKFHKYSIGNCSKIEEQFSGAIAVGSFKFWKDNGFSINKGNKTALNYL